MWMTVEIQYGNRLPRVRLETNSRKVGVFLKFTRGSIMLEPALPVQVAYTHGEQQLQLSQVCFILSRHSHNLDCEGQKKKTGALYPETAHEELRLWCSNYDYMRKLLGISSRVLPRLIICPKLIIHCAASNSYRPTAIGEFFRGTIDRSIFL